MFTFCYVSNGVARGGSCGAPALVCKNGGVANFVAKQIFQMEKLIYIYSKYFKLLSRT
jgi:hypothetical protein